MQRFKDRVIVVTGGSAGIGRASALRFATEGASVLILDVDEAGGQGTVEAITSAGGKAVFRSTDVTDERSVADAMTLCDQEFGPLDVLFNCVGGSSRDDTVVHELDLSLFERTIALDLKSVVICSGAALPRFSDRATHTGHESRRDSLVRLARKGRSTPSDDHERQTFLNDPTSTISTE